MGRKHGLVTRCLAAYLVAALAVGALPATTSAAPGDIVENGTPTGIAAAGFLFEPEVPFTSLKNVPLWNELEQLLDNPYLVTPDPTTPGNDQGFPSYRATGVIRRPGFGVTLPSFLTHPLNYNPTTGEEMRLINPDYRGGTFNVIDQLVEGPAGTFTWTRTPAQISPGADRVEQGATAIDYNNPVGPDAPACVLVTELNPPEGSVLCGGDPGEPGYLGFGVRAGNANQRRNQYSLPAVPGIASAGTPLPANARLVDPTRGVINPRNAAGVGGLRKPSLRVPPHGNANNPGYLVNTDPDEVTASSENDYVRNRNVAMALGKSLFWDMQVGSDGVQSCGTCHFNGTGTDTRTRNQINPNHLGGDLKLHIGNVALADGSKAANYDLTLADFPLHKLTNPDVAGDPLCSAAGTGVLTAQVNGGVLENTPNPATGATGDAATGLAMIVCNAANTLSDVNDVISSMGVHFGLFADIAPIGSFVADPSGVNAVAPDLRVLVAPGSPTADPIPAFAGTSGNEFRRVEPRNTPTMQAAAFNFDNFWDGRARHDFNGGSVFGAADPQSHVFVTTNSANTSGGDLTPTRQIIRFVSLASLATGPGLSEFEMSFQGRNWAKIGKKLLQAGVTPLANQLVDPDDSVLGPYSGQRSTVGGPVDRPGRPGLNQSYVQLIQQAFYPALWQNTARHLNGCYTDDPASPDFPALLAAHPNQCSAVGVPVAIPVLKDGAVVTSSLDPFDKYVLTVASGAASATDTNQFTQMEGNFSLFWGLAVNLWVQILVPDDTPFDKFLDGNPGAFASLGEPGEPGLVPDLLNCGQAGADPNYCFTPFGNFKRDPGVLALQNPTGEGGTGGTHVVSGGNRLPTDPDPLLGLDIFFASNLSLKNPNFRTARCGECHAIPTLTDHTMPFTSKINLMDAVAEFSAPGVELVVEPLARLRVISGFLLEAEITENGQDAVERRIVNQSIVPNPVDGLAYPGATAAGLPGFGSWTGADSAFLDNGMYNLGLRPISEDVGRGGNDAFGWPLSLSALMMKNLAGAGFNPGGDDPANGFAQPPAPGIAMATFDPDEEGFGLFESTAQDPQINPGLEGEPANPLLPPYLGAFANNITVGDFPPEMDEAGGAIGGMVNTLTDIAMIEGFMDTLGPFNPANVAAEVLNYGGFSDRTGDIRAQMGTWPNVNRVGRMGSFKAPQLRNVELTGPYFHNGGMLTLRQVIDFYTRGGDFPITNAAHRDFNLVNMNVEVQSNLSEAEKVALVDFLLELTDERNRFDRAPFDHPEVIVPVDGLAPDNSAGRTTLLANTMFRSVPQVGATGQLTAEPAFLNVTKARLSGADANRGASQCNYATGPVSHYCH
jgi:cytochrome c peroxidase